MAFMTRKTVWPSFALRLLRTPRWHVSEGPAVKAAAGPATGAPETEIAAVIGAAPDVAAEDVAEGAEAPAEASSVGVAAADVAVGTVALAARDPAEIPAVGLAQSRFKVNQAILPR